MPFLLPFLPAIAAAGAGIAGSVISGNAAQGAANTQAGAAQAGIDEQRRQFDVTQQNQQPFIQAGQQAVGSQGDLLGLNGPDKQQAAIAALQGSPGYQSLYHNGEQAVLANGSATGGLRGGNTQASLYNLGANTLSQTIQQQLSSLGGIAGLGAGTGTSLGQIGQGTSTSIGNLLGAQGSAKAGGILGGANGATGISSSLAALLGKILPSLNLGGGQAEASFAGAF